MMKRYTFTLLAIGFLIVAGIIGYDACSHVTNLEPVADAVVYFPFKKPPAPCAFATGNSTGTMFFQFDTPDSVQTNCISVNVSNHVDTLKEITIVTYNLDADKYFKQTKYFPVYRAVAPGDSDRYDVNLHTGLGRSAVFVTVNDCSQFFYGFQFDGLNGFRDDGFLTKQITQKLLNYNKHN